MRGIEVESEYGTGSTFWFKLLKDGEYEDEEEYKDFEGEDEEFRVQEEEKEKGQENPSPRRSRGSYETIFSTKTRNFIDYSEFDENSHIETKLLPYNFKHNDASMLSNNEHHFNTDPCTRNDTNQRQLGISFDFSGSRPPKGLDLEKVAKHGSSGQKASKSKKSEETKGYALIVDDNPFNLMIAQNFVEMLNYTVVTATNGKESLSIAKASHRNGNSIKIIFMDCQMPVMDGFEATVHLREMMRKHEIPVAPIIAITANDTEEDKRKCFKCGMVDHLAKPLLAENLKKCIAKFDCK